MLYIYNAENVVQPIDEHVLRVQIKNGELTPDVLVSSGTGEWMPYSQYKMMPVKTKAPAEGKGGAGLTSAGIHWVTIILIVSALVALFFGWRGNTIMLVAPIAMGFLIMAAVVEFLNQILYQTQVMVYLLRKLK